MSGHFDTDTLTRWSRATFERETVALRAVAVVCARCGKAIQVRHAERDPATWELVHRGGCPWEQRRARDAKIAA